MRIVIFDLETRLHAHHLSDNNEEGWRRLRGGDGGISACCVYDLQEQWLYIYDDHPLSLKALAAHLEAADVVVGYYSKAFDLPCLEGVFGRRLRIKEHLDLYFLLARTYAEKGIATRRGDLKLHAVCKRAFGRGKSGSGAHAPDLAAAGRFGELFNYCALDVRLTRDLLLYIGEHGGVPNLTGSFLPLRLPDGIRRVLHADK